MCTISDVNGWGPFTQQIGCGHLSFTLLFEEIVMTIVPIACVVPVVTLRFLGLRNADKKAVRRPLYVIKISVLVVVAALQVAQICVWSLSRTPKTRVSVPTAAVSLILTLVFIYLSDREHVRSARPSDTLITYCLVSIPLDVVRAYTLWTIAHASTIAAIFTVTIVTKVAVLVFESCSKGSSLKPPYARWSPEATSGIVARCLFWWLNPLMWAGYRGSLSIDDLFTLDDQITAETHSGEVLQRWENANQNKTCALLILLLRQYKRILISGVIPRLCFTGFTFAQPFLVERLINYVGGREPENYPALGNWLIISYLLVYVGIAISQAAFRYYTFRLITAIRGSLIFLLYDKTLKLDAKARSDSKNAPITLMNTDTEKIYWGLQTIHDVWGSLVEMGISIWLLERQLGLATVGSVLFCISCIVAGNFVAVMAGHRQTAWLKEIQNRTDFTSSMISRFRSVKMSGLVSIVVSGIMELREKEVETSKGFRKCLVGMVSFSYMSNIVAPILGFGVFTLAPSVHGPRRLDPARAFASLTIFAILTQAIGLFVQSALNTMAAVSGFERYRAHLLDPEWTDTRQLLYGSAEKSSLNEAQQASDGVELDIQHTAPLLTRSYHPERDTICVRAQQADIRWEKDRNGLSDVSFEIKKGQVVMVQGGMGAGKSTLLQALLGQTLVADGKLHTNFTYAAFCDQAPWLINGTVMQNVLGHSKLDRVWYSEVLKACQLDYDISRFPLGDQAMTGSAGIRLSGGQRNRLALARAVYSRMNVMIMDDVLSGLDPETAHAIVASLFGPRGLLRRLCTTVILATSEDSLLVYADQVLRITNGTVVAEERTPAPEVSDEPELEPEVEPHVVQRKVSSPVLAVDLNDAEASCEKLFKPFHTDLEAERKRHNSDMAVYLYYISTVGRRNSIVFITFCVILVFGLAFPQILVAWWAKSNQTGRGYSNATYLGIYVAIAIVALTSLLLGGFQLMLKMVPRSALILHNALLSTVRKAPGLFFSERDTGETVNRFSQDLEIVDTDIPLGSFTTVFSALTCLLQAVLVCVSSRYLAAVIPVCIILLFLVQMFYLRTSRQLRILDLEAKAPLVSNLMETIQGLTTIRAFGWDRHHETRNAELLARSQRPYYLLPMVQRWLGLVLDLMIAGVAVILVAVTVNVRGSSTANFLGVALTGIVNFGMSLNNLVHSWTTLETAIQAVSRIKVFETETASEENIPCEKIPHPKWPLMGNIEFEGVYASYDGGKSSVLENFNVSIASGQKVGICGRTGSGKSSLLAALCRMIDLDRGSIRIDGVDTSTIPREHVRWKILNVVQESFLIPGTIRFNVDPWKRLTDDQLIQSLKEVRLWDHLEGKGGLDGIANDELLSSGQRQLVCLARVLLQEGKVVVMDEATSSLDTTTDKFIRQLIRNKLHDRTILSIAHKLEHLLDCDRVMVIDRGRLVEYDAPDVLAADPTSKFRDVFRSSFRKREVDAAHTRLRCEKTSGRESRTG